MGSVQSTGINDTAKARSEKIESQLQKDRLVAKNEIKVLLLDAGESGKATFLKQMKLIHHGGYSDSERYSYKKIILSNIVQSMHAILDAISRLDLALAPQNDAHRTTILSLPDRFEGDVLPRDVRNAVPTMEAMKRSYEFQANDSAVYYFNSIERISSPSYCPTDQDILRSPAETMGVTETTFKVGKLTYKLIDVGGQKTERKKWIHCFENVTVILFLVNLSEYDQVLYEDKTVNRMQNALCFFNSVCNSQWFIKTPIVLFLNDADLFAEKLRCSPLEDYFPDYQGGANYDTARDYLRRRFVRLNRRAATKEIYTYYTYATDTQQIKVLLSAIQDILSQQDLRMRGLA